MKLDELVRAMWWDVFPVWLRTVVLYGGLTVLFLFASGCTTLWALRTLGIIQGEIQWDSALAAGSFWFMWLLIRYWTRSELIVNGSDDGSD